MAFCKRDRPNPGSRTALAIAPLEDSRVSADAQSRGPSLFGPVALVATTYVYFLIFAEFALLKLAAPFPQMSGRIVLAALGLGGISGSLLAGRLNSPAAHRRQLIAGYLSCAVAAVICLFGQKHSITLAAGAMSTGLALGWLTVTLASALSILAPAGRMGLVCGLGTGIAYSACNIPALFGASAQVQTMTAVSAAIAGIGALFASRSQATDTTPTPASGLTVTSAVLMLSVLVGLDSGAFNIIQHTGTYKAALWTGDRELWLNAGMHLLAAIASGLLLDRGWCRMTLAASGALLLSACSLLTLESHPQAGLIGMLYVAGVSLYSVALVFYPAASGRPRVAAATFAIAGWLGSAVGIGVTDGVSRIEPAVLVAAAGLLYAAFCLRPGGHGRARLLIGLSAAGLCLWLPGRKAVPATDLVAFGRATYISEGCIHCHSAYVRPHAPDDVLRWGPGSETSPEALGYPPLPGNRRQGPDLAMVGNRRTAEWHRSHLKDPRAFHAESRMPSYAHLFGPGDERGEALVAYLANSGQEKTPERVKEIETWQPAQLAPADATESSRLYLTLCSGCHDADGHGAGRIAGQLTNRPPDFMHSPWKFISREQETFTLARLIKFGLPGSPMAGHEWLSDRQVMGLVRHVQILHHPVGLPQE